MSSYDDNDTKLYPLYFAMRMDKENHSKLQEIAVERHMKMAPFLRWVIDETHAGRMLHLDRAMQNMTTLLIEGFGGGIALIAAEAERVVVESSRWEKGR